LSHSNEFTGRSITRSPVVSPRGEDLPAHAG
jgi:hypothetical protein